MKIINSPYSSIKIQDATKTVNLTLRLCRSLKQVKMIKEGKLPRRTFQELIDEL